ncbi:MAG TPA: RNA pseudouridine synthase [Accumulibacter sp.]|nr:RNA pseudouridine synthase [Accumulibacter sp.]
MQKPVLRASLPEFFVETTAIITHAADDPTRRQPYVLRHADPATLVLDKPAGLLAVPGRGEDKQDCLARRVMADFPEARVVHRLDMATSGLMVLARGDEMQRWLSRQFAERRVGKRYLAIVHGHLADVAGTIDLPLAADWPNRPRQQVDWRHGKAALTRYRRLAYDPADDCSAVLLWPETGRTHQLRVHLRAIGHPIVGDALYGTSGTQRDTERLMLHADELVLPRRDGGTPLCLSCPAPFATASLLAAIREVEVR